MARGLFSSRRSAFWGDWVRVVHSQIVELHFGPQPPPCFRVWNLGFWVVGLGFGVWNLGVGVWGFGFGVWEFGFRVEGLGFRFWGLGFRV